MGNIWDSDHYRNNYKNDGQLSYDIANMEKFTVTVNNDPDTGGSTHSYEILNDVPSISPAGYSLINYRQQNTTTNYSFTDISYDSTFKQLMSTMAAKYGYSITQE